MQHGVHLHSVFAPACLVERYAYLCNKKRKGQIIKISKNALILDLGPLGTGIVYGGELREDKDMLKELAVGQNVSALVLDPENEDGYVELSLREAGLEKAKIVFLWFLSPLLLNICK